MVIGEGIDVLAAAGAELGECPVWDSRTHRLVWVDIPAGRIHLTDVGSGRSDLIEVPLPVGAVALRAAGGFVAALEDGFWIVDDAIYRLTPVPEARPGLRFNDGKCDPDGRFWAGTMAYNQSRGAGALYRLDPDGGATQMLQGVTISNGLAWSPDGRTMYYVDTPTQRIDALSFVPATGDILDRRLAVRIPPEAGAPDGMTIDEEGGLWVALWGGGAVHRYLDGRLERVIKLPVSQPTSCTFGGENLDELYVTSAWEGLSTTERHEQPLAGALFVARPGMRGVPAAAYAGTR